MTPPGELEVGHYPLRGMAMLQQQWGCNSYHSASAAKGLVSCLGAVLGLLQSAGGWKALQIPSAAAVSSPYLQSTATSDFQGKQEVA